MDHFEADPKNPDDVFVNVGVGEDLSIKELAELIGEVVGYRGKIRWDSLMPDGTPRRMRTITDIARADLLCVCPYENGKDYPEGEACPRCPFWANRDRWTGQTVN